ncbi:MAG: hypothetical protein KTR16_02530 [Acidiferrobacterales bacterium]|nr:hypothetical protein [Acidiferrobacterales bacterium]
MIAVLSKFYGVWLLIIFEIEIDGLYDGGIDDTMRIDTVVMATTLAHLLPGFYR